VSIRPTTVTLSKESPRYADWIQVFGCNTVQVKGALPMRLKICGEAREAFLLDLSAITPEQLSRLVAHISEKFGIPRDEVEASIATQGVPILTEDTTWSIDMRLVM
jgi:hypothetical protein